ncbi:MAG: hypothetical protein PWP45_644 [Tepidanaerobacteraceae bacterium]|nr:hypothetical protein [Tepidanaerobacteraceae bacterium]
MGWYITKYGKVFFQPDVEDIIELERTKRARTKTSKSRKEDHRTAYCKNCGEPLDSLEDEICLECGWIICPMCGDCGCT